MRLRALLWLSIWLGVAPAFAQNSFAHFAYGQVPNAPGATWKTTFVFLNIGSSDGTVTLQFRLPNGQDAAVPIVGRARAASHTVTVPAGGSVRLAMDESTDQLTTGSVLVTITGSMRGQGIFRVHIPGQLDYEAASPMVTRDQPYCIINLPGTDVLVLPFDNTNGQTTSVAFANVGDAAADLTLQFLDETGASIFTVTTNMAGRNQTSFETNLKYPAVANMKGTLQVTANQRQFSALGFIFSFGPFSTLIPITR
jgi:hypothetical protein